MLNLIDKLQLRIEELRDRLDRDFEKLTWAEQHKIVEDLNKLHERYGEMYAHGLLNRFKKVMDSKKAIFPDAAQAFEATKVELASEGFPVDCIVLANIVEEKVPDHAIKIN